MFKEAVELYEAGLTQTEVATRLGTTQKVIWGLFKRHGYQSRVARKRNQNGINNDSWKGENAGYTAFHYRVIAVRGKPNLCVMCESVNKGMYHWANVSGRYYNVYDYIRLCASCHSIFDNKANNLRGGDIQ